MRRVLGLNNSVLLCNTASYRATCSESKQYTPVICEVHMVEHATLPQYVITIHTFPDSHDGCDRYFLGEPGSIYLSSCRYDGKGSETANRFARKQPCNRGDAIAIIVLWLFLFVAMLLNVI